MEEIYFSFKIIGVAIICIFLIGLTFSILEG